MTERLEPYNLYQWNGETKIIWDNDSIYEKENIGYVVVGDLIVPLVVETGTDKLYVNRIMITRFSKNNSPVTGWIYLLKNNPYDDHAFELLA